MAQGRHVQISGSALQQYEAIPSSLEFRPLGETLGGDIHA